MNKGRVKIGMTQFHCVQDRSENMKKQKNRSGKWRQKAQRSSARRTF